MFSFDYEYVLKSMLASVRDEGNRVVSLGLATHDDLKGLIEPTIQSAIKRATDGIHDKAILMNTLTDLHRNLSSVFFPGDFEKIASNEQEQLKDLLGLQDEEPVAKPEENQDEELDTESSESESFEEERTGLPDEQNVKEKNPMEVVYSTLEHISYKLGKTGDHEAAYLVERKMREIESLVVKGDIKTG